MNPYLDKGNIRTFSKDVGIITYGSLDVLTKATTFEVSFVTVDGGGTQVSWGSSGNAFAAGVGDGFGVFGGSGGWTNVG